MTEAIQSPVTWTWGNNILAHCKIDLVAIKDATVDLFNASAHSGSFYGLIESTDPKLAKTMHKSTIVKPWSFSTILFPAGAKRDGDGYHHVRAGSKGFWIMNTTSTAVRNAIVAVATQGKRIHLGRAEIAVQRVAVDDRTFTGYPGEEKDIDTITVKIHSPAFWYNATTKKFEQFSARVFLEHQLRKMNDLGIVTRRENDMNDIEPYFRVLRDDTSRKSMSITVDGKTRLIHGIAGHITFKLSGDGETKQMVWEILHASQFTGIGTRTSMGFGHCSITSIK